MTKYNALNSATQLMFQRYLNIIDELDGTPDPYADDDRLSLSNLRWLCDQGVRDADTLPIDKLSRWLGFVQGCLIMRGITSVDAERDISRPLFHKAYQFMQIDVPDRRERDARPAPPKTESFLVKMLKKAL